MSDLDQVTALGAIDAVLDDLDKKLAKQRARVPHADDAIDACHKTLMRSIAAYKAAKEVERATAREVEQYEKRRSQAQRALDSGMGNAEAADRQVQQCTSIIDELETRQLDEMETSEALDQAVKAAELALEAAEASRAEHAKLSPPIIEDLLARRAVAQAERDAIFPLLHAEVANRYTVLRRTKTFSVSAIPYNTCIPCRRTVAMAEAADVRRGLLRACRACGRYLVLEPKE
ncbi:MAG: hypothetical protein AB8H79_24360 [Myxococcota bacterium]